MSASIFWLSFWGLFYIYLGYPLWVWWMAKLRPRPVRKAPYTGTFSVVIAAYNEAGNLPKKIANLLASESVGQLSEIVIGSDGSDDGTVQRVKAVQDERIRLVEFPSRRGKAAVLNDLVPQCRADVVVLTDARQEIAPGALAELLANFSDEEVGVVSGELVFRGENVTGASKGIGFYWRYEKFIRRNESRFGSVPGATGALYAIRRKLFRPIHPETLLDDVAIPMQAAMQGSRCTFEERAIVFDWPSRSVKEENIRKRRTIAGNAQLILFYPAWLLPGRNPVWFQYVSHKVCRLVSPLCLIAALVACLPLSRNPLYEALFVGQVLFYAIALVGVYTSVRWCNAAAVFVSLNLTTIRALLDAATGRFDVKWKMGIRASHSSATRNFL